MIEWFKGISDRLLVIQVNRVISFGSGDQGLSSAGRLLREFRYGQHVQETWRTALDKANGTESNDSGLFRRDWLRSCGNPQLLYESIQIRSLNLENLGCFGLIILSGLQCLGYELFLELLHCVV